MNQVKQNYKKGKYYDIKFKFKVIFYYNLLTVN